MLEKLLVLCISFSFAVEHHHAENQIEINVIEQNLDYEELKYPTTILIAGGRERQLKYLQNSTNPNIEDVTYGLLFWRSFTHFIGGMGIIVFSIAILPMLGMGGVQLFRAEIAGPQANKLTPRVKQTAKLLWGIYIGFVLILSFL